MIVITTIIIRLTTLIIMMIIGWSWVRIFLCFRTAFLCLKICFVYFWAFIILGWNICFDGCLILLSDWISATIVNLKIWMAMVVMMMMVMVMVMVIEMVIVMFMILRFRLYNCHCDVYVWHMKMILAWFMAGMAIYKKL